MEFSALKADFVAAAQNVLRAVPIKSERADLSGIFIVAENGTITLSGTDTELGIKCQFTAQINTDGEALLPGRYLVDILRRLPPGPLLFRLDPSNDHVYINSGASHFELLALPADRFPKFRFDEQEILTTVPELALRTGINQVAFAAAKDGLRQLLNSVLISLGKNKMRLVATDGHRLALAETLELTQDITGDYLVPVRSLEEVARLISGQEEVQIAGTDKQISFRTKTTMVQSRLVEGKYLPYDSIIPAEFSWQAVVYRADLLAALERAELFSSDKINAVNLITEGWAMQGTIN
jgi:DNA polymerase-3 subunit beta